MRSAIVTALSGDLTLQAAGLMPAAIVAGDVDTPAERPFLNLRWGPVFRDRSVGPVAGRQLTIWVHDEPNDYSRIDVVVRRIRVVFDSLVGARDVDGWITQIDWDGDSEDLTDDGHGTIARQTNYTVVGSGY